MNTHRVPLNKVLRALSRISYITGVAFLIASLVLNFIPVSPVSAAPASVWTTRTTCNVPDPQDENHYTWGDTVYIRGSNFLPSTVYHWTIAGKPGGASLDPGIIVAAWNLAPGGPITTTADGYFCFAAYVIPPDDGGEYVIDVFEIGA